MEMKNGFSEYNEAENGDLLAFENYINQFKCLLMTPCLD